MNDSAIKAIIHEHEVRALNRGRREGFREGLGLALLIYGLLFVAVECYVHGWWP